MTEATRGRNAATGGDGRPRVRLGAHHDGSALHVPPGTPALGDAVPVRVRVPVAEGAPGPSVLVRVVEDGEPRVYEARADGGDAHERWFTADVPVTNPVTSYRFLLAGEGVPGGQAWLNGEGTVARDVPDAADFRLSVHAPGPEWARDAVVYQVFPDRFARSTGHDGPPAGPLPDWALPAAWDDEPIGGGPGTGTQLYGGDLAGVEARLDHLQRLGVDTLYLTPVFEGRSNHRYDARTFDHVDPLLGGDAAFASLARALHGRGMRLVGDLTTNHTGDAHDWFRRAVEDPAAEERAFYYWRDEDPGYVGWLGHASLPKLNHHAPALADRLFGGPDSVVGRYLTEPFRMDGWRVDVANMTGRQGADDLTHAVAARMRAAMERLSPDAVLIAEHFHDAGADLRAGGWHGTMNYSAFTRPVWTWLVDPESAADVRFVELPVGVPRRPGGAAVAAMRAFGAAVPWSVTTRQWNLLGSHDTARLRTVVGTRERVEVGAGLLLTYPGTPVLFAGDEGGVTGRNGEHARVPMPWSQIDAGGGDRWDAATFDVYRSLIALRRSSRALREGGLRWVLAEDDAVAYLRETPDERVLVLAARAPWSGAVLPGHLLAPGETPANLYGGADLPVDPDGLHLPGDGPGLQVWRLG